MDTSGESLRVGPASTDGVPSISSRPLKAVNTVRLSGPGTTWSEATPREQRMTPSPCTENVPEDIPKDAPTRWRRRCGSVPHGWTMKLPPEGDTKPELSRHAINPTLNTVSESRSMKLKRVCEGVLRLPMAHKASAGPSESLPSTSRVIRKSIGEGRLSPSRWSVFRSQR